MHMVEIVLPSSSLSFPSANQGGKRIAQRDLRERTIKHRT